MLLQVKVTIVDSEPTIWRLLEIDPSLTLDRMHDVIQTAVGWRDSHLHCFTDADPYLPHPAAGSDAREPRRWVPEAMLEDSEDDLPESEWALGNVLTAGSGPLFYEYDFGDGWTHRLDLMGSFPAQADAPRARLLEGSRRAPLEDSGGIHGYQNLLQVLGDSSHDEHKNLKAWVAWTTGPWQEFDAEWLDIDAANDTLNRLFPDPAPSGSGAVAPSLIEELAQRMPPGIRREFRSHMSGAGLDGPVFVEAGVAEAMTAPYLWLIRRIGHDGVSLTAAGWLPPAIVQAAMTELGWNRDWIGKANREDLTPPVFRLRESAQQLGLIRKVKGRLVLSAATKRLASPVDLWHFIARALAVRHRHDAERDAALLLLLEIAGGERFAWNDNLEAVAFGLGMLGWATRSGEDLPPESVHELLQATREVLRNLGIFAGHGGVGATTDTTHRQAFARAVLQA